MEITEVRVRLAERKRDRLRAFCSITFEDAFVVRDVKVIQGNEGLFVAMPSRKLTDRCPSCGSKNQLRSRYCGECGAELADNRAELDERGRPRLYVDVAHPINVEARDLIEQAVLKGYHAELERAAEPGYQARPLHEDYRDEGYEGLEESHAHRDREERVSKPEPETEKAEAEQRPSRPSSGPPVEREHGFGAGIFDDTDQ